MGGSCQKDIGNNQVVPRFVGDFQYFERKNNIGCDERIGETIQKTLGFQQGILNEAFI